MVIANRRMGRGAEAEVVGSMNDGEDHLADLDGGYADEEVGANDGETAVNDDVIAAKFDDDAEAYADEAGSDMEREEAETEATYETHLNALQASSVRALLKSSLERIALVGVIEPEISRQAHELAQSVGEEVGRVIGEQRDLEQRFESLVTQRAVLQTMPNKLKLKENQRQLAEIAQRLRVTTLTLTRNLQENPSVAENMAKIAKERISLSSFLATLVTEAETNGYETLVRTANEDREKQMARSELQAKERETCNGVKLMKQTIRDEKAKHEQEMAQYRQRLVALKEAHKELNSTVTVNTRYREKEVASTNSCAARTQNERIAELERTSLKLKQRIEVEKRVSEMSRVFLKTSIDRLTKDEIRWTNKHDEETHAKDRELETLKARYQTDAAKVLEVEQKYQQEVAAKDLRLAEEKRLKEAAIAGRQSEETRERAALKIQALFRGHKARAAAGGGGGGKKKKK